jgi:multidrug efflux pump subunit AcrB
VVALDSEDPANNESVLYDVGRYEVRNMIMALPGAVAPVVFGGKIRAVLAYLDRQKMQARGFSPLDIMNALDAGNVFLPSGDGKFGDLDYVLDSNSMFDYPSDMGDIPLRFENGRAVYLRDVATPKDANFIQTNVVRVSGRRVVYIPVYRQLGASTLAVVQSVGRSLKTFEERLSRSGINLKLVMDQSIYVKKSIEALVQEGVLGAILCSLVILLFLGEIRMTAIAIMTLPISIMASSCALYFAGQTINVMTLAGMTLAIGPMIDSAIICLENTHRHLGLGATTHEAAFLGASEVAMPELVSTLCTFLVLSPLVFTPGLGQFLFKPMAMAVAFSMIAAYFLSRTLVPACSAYWLKPHAAHAPGGDGDHGAKGDAKGALPSQPGDHETFRINGNGNAKRRRFGMVRRAFARWEQMIESGIGYYAKGLDGALRHPILTVSISFGLLAVTIGAMWPIIRRDFFPEVDAGAFEMYVRAHSGLRIEETEKRIKAVEDFVHATIDPEDLELVLSEIGVTSDWSAAYTANAGPMDAVVKIQLTEDRKKSAQEYVHILRTAFKQNDKFGDLEFAFDAGGMVRAAMNEGKSTPISIRVTGKNGAVAHKIATEIKGEVEKIDGVVDARIVQRLNYPQYVI